jgi:heme exporter protein B
LKQFFLTLNYELKAEKATGWRLGGLLLSAGIIYAIRLALGGLAQTISPALWAALYWLMQWLIGVQALERLFGTEYQQIKLYNYQTTTAQTSLWVKLATLATLLVAMAMVHLALFNLWLPVLKAGLSGLLLFSILLGSISLAGSLALVGGLASGARQPGRIMAFLALPVALPQGLISIKMTKLALDGLPLNWEFASQVGALGVIGAGLAVLLYPGTWHQ